jgi:hypothetical protein
MKNYKYYFGKPVKFILFTFLNLFLACTPWSSDTNKALDLAGENKTELEKVLIHYSKNDADSLKLKAAEYLISNMIYQYSIVGSGVDSINATYKYVYGARKEDRSKLFKSDSLQKGGNKDFKYDLQNVSSEFLIEQIESAFRIYKYDWCKKYSFKMFCEYILPYKFPQAANVDWRTYANQKFFPSFNLMFFEGENAIYEAESFTKFNSDIVAIQNASGDKVFHLYKMGKNKFNMSINSNNKGWQKFVVNYINGNLRASNVRIKIDGKVIGDFLFPSTGSWEKNNNAQIPIEFLVNLDFGEHNLTMESLDKDLFIDFLIIPESIKIERPELMIADGIYYLKNSAGWLTLEKDSLVNSARVKITNNFSKATPLEITSDGLFYQIKFRHDATSKVIDASQEKKSSFVSVYDNFSKSNQKWGIIPNKKGDFQIRNKATNKILSSEKENILIQSLEDSPTNNWLFQKDKKAVFKDTVDSVIKAAMRVTDITNRFHWSGESNMAGLINSKNIIDFSYGSCPIETQYQTMVLRSLGVASTIDFVFNWGNRHSGHEWSVVFDHKGNSIQNNCHNPVGAVIWNSHFKKGKIYRKSNTINKNSLFVKNNGEETIPDIFNNPYFLDVTEEYCDSRDVSIQVNKSTKAKNKYGYILVHNNRKWTPIAWGERSGSNFGFKKLEKDILYLPAQFDGNDFKAFNDPFFIDSLGKTQKIIINPKKKHTVSISRKYPYYKADKLLDKRIVGSKFQGSNRLDFSDAVTIGVVTEKMTNPIFYTITSNTTKKFKYFRFIGSDNSFCNINEIVIYDNYGKKLDGKIFGTAGSFEDKGNTIEKAFDKDVLSSFEAPNPNGGWVGLAFNKPSTINKIRFIGRNDGNMVEIGDEYELFFWDKTWKSLGRKKASSGSLVFKNVPDEALLLLHNLYRGYEERPFTVKNGKQIWW